MISNSEDFKVALAGILTSNNYKTIMDTIFLKGGEEENEAKYFKIILNYILTPIQVFSDAAIAILTLIFFVMWCGLQFQTEVSGGIDMITTITTYLLGTKENFGRSKLWESTKLTILHGIMISFWIVNLTRNVFGNLNRDSEVRRYPRDFYRVQLDHENGTNIRNDYYIISDMYIWNNHEIGNVHERRLLLGGKTYPKILFTQQ